MEPSEKYYYKWDDKLKLGNEKFGKILNTNAYDENAAKSVPFPSDYILALLAQAAYKDTDYALPENWELLTTATNSQKTNLYFGVAFWNSKLCQIVVAHRGTDPRKLGAVLTDIQLGINQGKTGQAQSATTFVHMISEEIKRKNLEDGHPFQLSITGHSLGAWLGQVTTFTNKYFKRDQKHFIEDREYLNNIHVHTVVFESPGCREVLKKLVKKFVPPYCQRKFGKYDTLDMTVYLSKLNFINSINRHVGTMYMVQAETHSIDDILPLFNSKTHKIEREILLDFKSGLFASGKQLLKKMLPFNSSKIIADHILKKPANEHEHSLNVFTEEELEFVKDWVVAIKHKSPNVHEFGKSLPEFEIDHEYNTIKSRKLLEAIACIKCIRPTRTTIFNLLETDVLDRVYFEIFKLEAEYFQKNLLSFHTYYFRDRYELTNFFKSSNQVLHIRVDRNSILEFEYETSILYNILKFYQKHKTTADTVYFEQGQFCFLNWNKVHKVRNFLPKILKKEDNKIKLLIVECFEANEEDEESILEFIHECQTKMILLSTDQFSWENESGLRQVSGFENKIAFQDLTEDSQRQFMAQPNFKLNGKYKSISDILNLSFPLEHDLYEHFNEAVPVHNLLGMMLVPPTDILTLDCPYNNLLTPVVFLDLYREIDPRKISKVASQELQFVIQGPESANYQILSDENPFIQIQEADFNFEQKCVENFNLNQINYLCIAINEKLYLNKIFNVNFYMPRKILYQTTVESTIFNNLDEDLNKYYFCGDKLKFTEMSSYLNPERKEFFKFLNSQEKVQRYIKYAKSNMHILEIESGTITWLCSCGNIESLRRYMQVTRPSIKENNIADIGDIVILSGEPGIGKSSTIGHLFFQLKESHWVFSITLKHSNFDDLSNGINFKSVSKFILKNSGISNIDFNQHLLSYCLKNAEVNLPIYIMFDGFDEIHEKEFRQKFIDLLIFLKEFSKVKILITTRKYRCKELENGISIFASHYEEFDEKTEMLNFFIQFQDCQLDLVADNNKMQNVIPNILNNIQNLFGNTIFSFIGIPMQMRMIAEVLTLQNSSSSIALVDILNLYQKYTELHYNTYFQRIGLEKNEAVKRMLCTSISKKLYNLALRKMFNIDTENIDELDIEELNKVGLIQSDYSNNFEFLHDSVRDYFVAYFLKLWLQSGAEPFHGNWELQKFIVSDFLLDGEYKEVRLFLNCYLKNEGKVRPERLMVCQNKLEELWKFDKNLFFNDNNKETFIHICVRENLVFLFKTFMLKILNNFNRVELLSRRNSELETPLFLAIKLVEENREETQHILTTFLEELNVLPPDDTKVIIFATLYTHFITSDNIETLNTYSKNYPIILRTTTDITNKSKYINSFLEASKSNDLEKINEILKNVQNDKIARHYLLLATNAHKETCLHLTSSWILADKLLKLGADKDLQDYHGMTPLTRAIKEGRTQIATKLINKGALLTKDFVGYSPLLHAAKYNRFEVLKLLLNDKNSKLFIDSYNVFHVTALMMAAKNGHESLVTCLLDKGANISATDWNEMTPVYHAVKGNHTKLISIFRKRGANLDVADQNGIRPLIYSITNNKWDMVNSLLDNGASVNIHGSGSSTPLKLLIEKDKQLIVRKVLEEQVRRDKNGKISFRREAAKTNLLTDEEKNYISNIKIPPNKKNLTQETI